MSLQHSRAMTHCGTHIGTRHSASCLPDPRSWLKDNALSRRFMCERGDCGVLSDIKLMTNEVKVFKI